MKFVFQGFVLLLFTLIISGCTEHVQNKHEQLYLNAADSLTLYQNAPYLQKELAGNEKARDLLELDYQDFKEKHSWNDKEMDVFAGIIQGHVRVAKTVDSFKSL
ncbi:MAG: hypothetical protein P8P74_04045 [Crocinitomicaceae bacterium]|nr:hypothetical protein [Crocinitomicaceae bacterium]